MQIVMPFCCLAGALYVLHVSAAGPELCSKAALQGRCLSCCLDRPSTWLCMQLVPVSLLMRAHPAVRRFNAMASLFASLNTFPAEAGIVNRQAQLLAAAGHFCWPHGLCRSRMHVDLSVDRHPF